MLHVSFLLDVAIFLSSIAQLGPAADSPAIGMSPPSSNSPPINNSSPGCSQQQPNECQLVHCTCDRAMTLLQWLHTPTYTKPFMHGKNAEMQRAKLLPALWGILHGTLIHHVHSHDFQLHTLLASLLSVATKAFHENQMRELIHLTELLTAILVRLAGDEQARDCQSWASQDVDPTLSKSLMHAVWNFACKPPESFCCSLCHVVIHVTLCIHACAHLLES